MIATATPAPSVREEAAPLRRSHGILLDMFELTRRGRGWLLGEVRITDGARVWMRALGLPWRRVTLRIVGGALLVEEDPPLMPAVSRECRCR